MSRTQTHVIYDRRNHLPTPNELRFRSGPAVVVSGATTPPNADIASSIVETSNRRGELLIDHSISNPSDAKIIEHAQLYTKQVRSRWTGEIMGTFDRVYQWTRRSITYVKRELLIADGVSYPIHPLVGELTGRPADISDGKGPVNRSITVHFPFDVEVYDPKDPGDMLGPDIDYTVTFVTWDAIVISTQYVKPGGTAVPPASPERPGNTFVGWSEAYVNVQRDMIIRPIYSNDELPVTWVNWNGDVLKSEMVKFGSAATPPVDPSRIGHTFVGWDTDYTFITGPSTITAQYVAHQFIVTFLDWDGTLLATKTVNYGEPPQKMIDPVRDHYNFTGWDRDLSAVTSNITTTAMYTLKTFKVTYRDSITGDAIKIETVGYGKVTTPPTYPWSTNPIYNGYDFIGWDHTPSEIIDNVTIMSMLAKKQITITVKDGFTGGIIEIFTMPYGSSFAGSRPPDHTDQGREFDGWAPAPGDEMLNMIKNTTVIAKYTIRWLSLMFLTETGAYTDPPGIYVTYRVRYDFTLTLENQYIPMMSNAAKTMDVEHWYYLDQVEGRMKVLTADTRIRYDMLLYPRFGVPTKSK